MLFKNESDGDTMRSIRKEFNLSQVQFSKVSNISIATVRAIEQEVNNASDSTKIKMSEAWHILSGLEFDKKRKKEGE